MEDPAGVAVRSDASGERFALVCHLRTEVAPLRPEVGRLQRENFDVRQPAGSWPGRPARAVERVPTLDKRVQELEAEKRRLRQQACGRQTEKANRSDADWLKGLEDQPGARPRGQRPDRPGPQRRDSAHVPARGEAIELPLAERGGPPCGPPYREWAETE